MRRPRSRRSGRRSRAPGSRRRRSRSCRLGVRRRTRTDRPMSDRRRPARTSRGTGRSRWTWRCPRRAAPASDSTTSLSPPGAAARGDAEPRSRAATPALPRAPQRRSPSWSPRRAAGSGDPSGASFAARKPNPTSRDHPPCERDPDDPRWGWGRWVIAGSPAGPSARSCGPSDRNSIRSSAVDHQLNSRVTVGRVVDAVRIEHGAPASTDVAGPERLRPPPRGRRSARERSPSTTGPSRIDVADSPVPAPWCQTHADAIGRREHGGDLPRHRRRSMRWSRVRRRVRVHADHRHGGEPLPERIADRLDDRRLVGDQHLRHEPLRPPIAASSGRVRPTSTRGASNRRLANVTGRLPHRVCAGSISPLVIERRPRVVVADGRESSRSTRHGSWRSGSPGRRSARTCRASAGPESPGGT